jgi:hypothetical protein
MQVAIDSGQSPVCNGYEKEKTRIRVKRKLKFKKRLHEGNNIKRKALPIDESETALCLLLWQSTVIQALYDLASRAYNTEAKLARADAAAWFAMANKKEDSDFDFVCELAGLSRTKVLKMARKVAREGEKALEGFNFRTIRKDLSDRAPTPRTRRK